MPHPTLFNPSRSLATLAAGLRAQAEIARQRRMLLLSGEASWCREAAASALRGAGFTQVLWVGAQPRAEPAVSAGQVGRFLGRELEAVVFDAHSGFDVDAFGLISGTVRGGGLFILLTPPQAQWAAFPDPEHARIAVYPYRPEEVSGRFLARFAALLAGADGVLALAQGHPLPPLPPPPPPAPPTDPVGDPACRTADQAAAVAALIHVITGQRRRPVVLTSDRGRGKSAALGIAAARLLQGGLRHIVITAPRLEAVGPVFDHAARLLPAAQVTRAHLTLGEGRVEFVPPDELFLAPVAADLVLVDEAAAIPTPILERLLGHYPRIAFATTVHGYEGTGRGFAVRFHKVLEARSRGWRAVRMEAPIRWAPGDPLERLVFRSLLLDAAAAPDEVAATAEPTGCAFERLERAALARDEATLSQLFGLLVLAHYRTRPLDLRHLLDGPNLTVHVARSQGHVVATALVAREGGFDGETARGVWAGRIRPHGHLLPESLAAHLGLEEAPRLCSARVMRIAVHPAAQGRGIGSRLLQQVVESARREGLDLMGSSFGATSELLEFWAGAEFRPVRVSVKRGATSGAHSVIVLRPLSAAGAALFATARGRFLDHLPHLLGATLRELDPAQAMRLLRRGPDEASLGGAAAQGWTLDRQDWEEVAAFAFGRRIYEACLVPVWKLAGRALAEARPMPPAAAEVLTAKVMQGRGWSEVAQLMHLSGRAAVVEALRVALRPLSLSYGGGVVQEALERLQVPPAERG